MAEQREIKYVNRDFNDFRNQLIEYTKNYFPNTYNDFSPSSPGMLFIEMASYVGDILSFYQDSQLQETFLTYAKDPKNLYSLAYMMGYRPKTTGVSTVDIEITQDIEADTSNGNLPKWSQAAIIPENLQITSTDSSQTKFLIDSRVDFAFSSSFDPTEVTIKSIDGSGVPTEYTLKKTVKAFSSEIKTTTFNINSVEQFKTLTIQDSNIVGILDITDADSNEWYEVPFLGQDTIYESEDETASLPHVLSIKKVPRRFVTRYLSTGYLQIQFGAGSNSNDDSLILPDPTNVGLGSTNGKSKFDIAYDPSNFLYSKSYGIAPSSNLTVRYLKGGGITANVPAGSITAPSTNVTITEQDGVSTTRVSSDFLTFNNPKPAAGGRDGDTVEELRENSLRAFNEQSRAVTLQDYAVRVLSLPPKFGSVAKAYVAQEQLTDSNVDLNSISSYNPFALALYVLAYDNNGKLINAPITLKENIKKYLADFIMISDSVNIKDAFIVNIGIEYDVVTRPNYSGRDVIARCNIALKDYFNTSKRSINQSINLNQLYTLLDKISGVQTVQKLEIKNKQGGNYSPYAYDISGAIKNNIIYPSYDPCIFEVKYPDVDIKGRITTI